MPSNKAQGSAHHDSLFAQPLGSVAEFRFDKAVVEVFPDMLKRSIPGYQSIISQSGLLAARFAKRDSRLYDLGSSLGATSLSMHQALLKRAQSETITGCEIHAIDNSQAMLAQSREVIRSQTGFDAINSDAPPLPAAQTNSVPVVLHYGDIQQAHITSASVVALNFTLQFIPPADREPMMRTIFDGMLSGGALIISEKVQFSDPLLNELYIQMYHDFKKANGYSELEVSQKRTALENVLIPDTIETHAQRLEQVGFRHCKVWFQYFNFVSIIAVKD